MKTIHRATAIALAGCSLMLASAQAAAQAATAYQIDAAHSGATRFRPALKLPLRQRWQVTLPGALSYPVIADGRVYLLSAGLGGDYGTQLHALDAATGQRLWSRPISGTYFWSGHTWGNGQLYVVNFDGLLRQFDGATGAPGWSVQLPGQYAFSAPPTFAGGSVYISGSGSGGTVYAVDAATGTVRWTSQVNVGDQSSPAVSNRGVYVSYACNHTYAFDPVTGNTLWTYAGSCSGGGGRTPVLSSEIGLMARDFPDDNLIFGLRRGKVTGRFSAGPAPAVVGSVSYAVSQGQLRARDHATGQDLWTSAVSQQLTTAPIVVDGIVFVGDGSGRLYGVDAANGVQRWSAAVGAAIPGPDEHNVSQPLTGLGAGEGLIVVPAGNTVTAFGR